MPSGLTYRSSCCVYCGDVGRAYVSRASQVTVWGGRGLENDLAGVWYRAVLPK